MPHRPPLRRRLALALAVLALLVGSLGAVEPAAGASSTSVEAAMANSIVGWVNAGRAAHGLRPLRVNPQVGLLATERAANLARAADFSHQAAGGDIGASLSSNGVRWMRYGEAIGWTTYPWGTRAARSIYLMWMKSPGHRAILMGNRYNYIGIGLAYRSSSGVTYGSLLATESPDRTAPVARMARATRTGHSILFRWTARETALQTHTAGLRGIDVAYRVDDGAWRQIRTNVRYFATRLPGRQGGHFYSLRVRARDRAGNVSAWSRAIRVWVP